MLNFRTILLPVDFPHPSLGVIHQAATLAHHFHSEIVMLHVVTVQSHAAGVPSTGLRLSPGTSWRRSSRKPRGTRISLSAGNSMALAFGVC